MAETVIKRNRTPLTGWCFLLSNLKPISLVSIFFAIKLSLWFPEVFVIGNEKVNLMHFEKDKSQPGCWLYARGCILHILYLFFSQQFMGVSVAIILVSKLRLRTGILPGSHSRAGLLTQWVPDLSVHALRPRKYRRILKKTPIHNLLHPTSLEKRGLHFQSSNMWSEFAYFLPYSQTDNFP